MNTILAPAEPNAMPSSEEASIIIFFTIFSMDSEPRATSLAGRGVQIIEFAVCNHWFNTCQAAVLKLGCVGNNWH